MPVRRVVGHPVDDHAQTETVGFVEKGVEVGQRAEDRVDVAVVGDVIAEVGHGRREERREPHRVDPEPDQVGEMGADAVEVADAVAVGVGEGARVDLVDDGPTPPRDGSVDVWLPLSWPTDGNGRSSPGPLIGRASRRAGRRTACAHGSNRPCRWPGRLG